ncbi:hypothetical protein NE604_12065 [Anaerofustis stercorihominis]|uniref:Uncharacterized protein n=1 Tax=Anaerofustis stercorihominis DSM 17244 TaxID=445971 RepID=B1CBC9_9FIRM|nr:hypothetical protein [Anaerofustis stercorihominis]EDS71576.1 hypothetical protein ANASTE_01278 [Anaerofustis stercorihominis DSM 17244]MCQ4796365.1 hypothetical protein [Anaerofustis stercorihominis]
MKKSIYKENGIFSLIKSNLFGIILFLFIFIFIISGINSLGSKSKDEEMKIAKDSINKAIVSCYAIEGKYPKDFDYLAKNYGVHINEDKYKVNYQIFASNIFPDVTIIER